MAKIVTILPEIKVYSHEFDQFYSTTKLSNEVFICSITFPPNETDDDIVYNLEAYSNDEATGIITQVKVKSATTILYEEIKSFTVTPEELPSTGGEIVLYIRFDDYDPNLPMIRVVTIPDELQNSTVYRYISNTGDIYISSDKENSGIWMYNKNYNIFDQIFDYGDNWCRFIEASNGRIWLGSSNTSVVGMYYIHETSKEIIQRWDAGTNWFIYHFELSSGSIIVDFDEPRVDRQSFYILEPISGNMIPSGQYGTHTGSRNWGQWLEASNGNVYFSDNDYLSYNMGSMGVFRANVNWGTRIITTSHAGTNRKLFETSKGILLTSTGTNPLSDENGDPNKHTGIILVDTDFDFPSGVAGDKACTQIFNEGYGWINFFESSTGRVLVSSNNSESLGIYEIFVDENKNVSATKIIPDGYGWLFYESNDGYIYAISSDSDSPLGVIKITNDESFVIINNGYGHIDFESSNNKLYVTMNIFDTEILYMSDIKTDTTTKLSENDKSSVKYFHESLNNNIYYSNNEIYPGIFTIIEERDIPDDNYMQITTADELFTFAETVNSNPGTSYHAILMNDIDLEGREWTPIGNHYMNCSFRGVFNGNGYTIRGLTNINRGTDVSCAFVGTNVGIIKNLTIEGNIEGILRSEDPYLYVSGIAGRNGGSIENCHNRANISGKSISDYTPSIYVSGICSQHGGYITNCSNLGNITSVRTSGGIVGTQYGGTIEGCYNAGVVSSVGEYALLAAGISASMYSRTNSMSVLFCNNMGNVSITESYEANTVVAGICIVSDPESDEPRINIKNCYNIGYLGNASRVSPLYSTWITNDYTISASNNYHLSNTLNIANGEVTEEYMISEDMIELLNADSNNITSSSLYKHSKEHRFPEHIWQSITPYSVVNIYPNGYNWKYWEEKDGAIIVLSDKPYGELKCIDGKFVLDGDVDTSYAHNLYGNISIYSDSTHKTKLWLDKNLIIQLDDEYVDIIHNENVLTAAIKNDNVDKLLIVID